MSWKSEVNTAGDPPDAWTTNALRFATKEEADTYGLDLALRWTAVRDVRSTECDDPVNYRITGLDTIGPAVLERIKEAE